MKVAIDIDFNKLDYDQITAAIVRKLDEVDFIYDDVDINMKAQQIVDERVDTVATNYIVRRFGSTEPEPQIKDLIISLATEHLKKKINPIIDEAVKAYGGEEKLLEVVCEIFPKVFTEVLYSVCRDVANRSLRTIETDGRRHIERQIAMIRNVVHHH